ncbi:MAG: hypothetical protein JWM41_1782 [Gemmatimonadetes bacterium]|nr:hypothetical protein [Gemmatimonadota bacterium]
MRHPVQTRRFAVLLLLIALPPVHGVEGQAPRVGSLETCPAPWPTSVERPDAELAKCREGYRRDFMSTLQPPARMEGGREFIINPLTLGKSAPPRWPSHAGLRIHVINLNPYLYVYKITVKQTPIAETAALDFFKALIPAMPSITVSDAGGGRGGSFKTLDVPACSERGGDALNEAIREAAGLSERSKQLISHIAALTSLERDARSKEETVTNQMATTATVQLAALTAIDRLRDYSNGIDPTIAEISEFHRAFGPHLARRPNIPPQCDRARSWLDEVDSTLATRDTAFSRASEKLKAPVAKLSLNEAVAAEIDWLTKPLLEKTSFYSITDIDRGTSQIDSVTIQRRPASKNPPTASGASDPQFVTVMVVATRMGLPRLFSVGGGLAYTPTPYRSYSAVKRYTGGSVAADTVVSVVTEQARDSRKIAPMLTLGAMFPFDPFWSNPLVSGVGAQIGATVNKDAPSTAIEYFLGGSVNLLENRVFVAYGGYAAKEQSLVDGYVVGGRLPGAQTTVPTTTNTRWRSSWMFGFRFY